MYVSESTQPRLYASKWYVSWKRKLSRDGTLTSANPSMPMPSVR